MSCGRATQSVHLFLRLCWPGPAGRRVLSVKIRRTAALRKEFPSSCAAERRLLPAPPTDPASRSTPSPAASALQALRASVHNFDAATAALPGLAWTDGSSPCSAGGTWRGVTCGPKQRVTALDLSGVGLEGSLPPQLAALHTLERLNLSGNALSGGLPKTWLQRGAFSALRSADLSRNQLEGGSGWSCAGRHALPSALPLV